MSLTQTAESRDERLACRVLDILDRWDERLQGHQTQKREFPRRKFRARITVYIESDGVAGECAESMNLDVWARNISQAGLAFVYQGQIKAENIVVCLDPDAGGKMWYQAEIVRSRQVHNEFREYGIRFTGSAQI